MRSDKDRWCVISHDGCHVDVDIPGGQVPPNVSPSLARFELSCEGLLVSLLGEWKTLNVL